MSDLPRPVADPAPVLSDPPSESTSLSRRLLLGGGAALGVGIATLGPQAASASPVRAGRRISGPSLTAAVRFLQGATDAYRSTGPRLAQSYQDDNGLSDTAFVYDNALAVIALLAGGDVTRARAIGDALRYAQTHDERGAANAGRLRQAYHANDFVNTNGTTHFGWEYGFGNTAVGDMAWAGIALAQLARRTRAKDYLTGAVAIGEWIKTKKSNEGLGGYTFGEREGLEGHKSAEHNIDVYAFFRLLASLSTDRAEAATWRAGAAHAWAFVEKLWNEEAGFFYTGSNDGSTVNTAATERPLDVQTWAWLAARPSRYAEMLDWAATNLAVTDTPVRKNSALTGNLKLSGVAFGTGSLLADPNVDIDPWNGKPDDAAVWFEGTAQLVLALRDRHRGRDELDAEDLLSEIRTAQRELGQGQKFGGKVIPGGIVAASSPLNTGFGFGYFPNLHVGATAWYVMAGARANPYRFL